MDQIKKLLQIVPHQETRETRKHQPAQNQGLMKTISKPRKTRRLR